MKRLSVLLSTLAISFTLSTAARAQFCAGEESTLERLGRTITEAQMSTCFTFWDASTLPHRRFTSYLWNDISTAAMHITDFADDVTVADLEAALAGDSPRGDAWEIPLYAAVMLEYMNANHITSMRRHDLVRAVKDDFAVKAEQAASEYGSEAGYGATLLAFEEARRYFSKPLLDVYMYIRGRNPAGDRYGLCPIPLSGELPPAITIPGNNAVDAQLAELVQHLGVRKLSIPTAGAEHGPNEWYATIDVVPSGTNTRADAEALARERFGDVSKGYVDYYGNGGVSVFDGVDLLDPTAVADVSDSQRWDGEAEVTLDDDAAREKLLELIPGTDLRGAVETQLDDLDSHILRFEAMDYGAEVIGDSVLILTPKGGTHSVVIHISYVHA